jgi:hypothetical protein
MLRAKLIIDGKEILLEEGITTIGRASDNKVCLTEDFNVSRYHAEIECKEGRFWLTDLRSSNGTTVNGIPVTTTIELFDGDLIVLGGKSRIEFHIEEIKKNEQEKKQSQNNEGAFTNPSSVVEVSKVEVNEKISSEVSKGSSFPFGLAGLFSVLMLVFVVVFAFFLYEHLSKPTCQAKAKIISPENGDLISKETEINIEVQNSECMNRLIVLLEDEPIATIEQQPFVATLNPGDFPEFSDGLEHSLKLVIEDSGGKKSVADTVSIAIETASIEKPEESTTNGQSISGEDSFNGSEPASTGSKRDSKISLIETQQSIQQVLKQFSGGFAYKFDEQFLQEVQRKTSEYAEEGYFSRAENYRDLINIEFHKENGLEAPVGFLLAMSRSKFNPQKQGNKEGLWQLSEEFLATNGYKTLCPNESLSDKDQSCAAKTAAVYTKALFLKVFNGDLIYTVAAFGMNEKEAFSWMTSLPANRADFWKIIKRPEQRENLVRFFAAAIVAENPQKFNLKRDRPISELYRSLIISPTNR